MALTDEEIKWRDDLQRRAEAFCADTTYDDRIEALSEMRDIAAKLHASLKQRGHAPRHHAYMIENRGVPPDHNDFYFHIHPIQDLIAFTYDANANDDPEDQTINHEFTIQIYTRRFGHADRYTLRRTALGWVLSANIYSGPCDKSCAPLLYDCLRHDSVVYPRDVGEWFEWLWQQAKEKGLSHDEVQKGLNDIADWIETTERSTPVNGVWKGLA